MTDPGAVKREGVRGSGRCSVVPGQFGLLGPGDGLAAGVVQELAVGLVGDADVGVRLGQRANWPGGSWALRRGA